MDNLVNVVVGAVVDASAYTFAAQTVIVVFARLDVIFNENLFHLAFFFFNKTIRMRFMSICPGHGDRQLDVESLLKGWRVLLGVVRWCRAIVVRQSFSRHKVSRTYLSITSSEWSGSNRIHFFENGTVGCGVFIISTSVLKYAHCFAIVDESCTVLSACTWLLRMSIGTASWREDASNC